MKKLLVRAFQSTLVVATAGGLVAGCVDDPEKKPTFSVSASPPALALQPLEESKVVLKAQIKHVDGFKLVAMKFASSNTEIVPNPDDADIYLNTPVGVIGAKKCGDVGQVCYMPLTGTEAVTLTLRCKEKKGEATVAVTSELRAAREDTFWQKGEDGKPEKLATVRSRQTLITSTDIKVSCAGDESKPMCDTPETEPVGWLGESLLGDATALCDKIDYDVSHDPVIPSAEHMPVKEGAGDHTESYGQIGANLVGFDQPLGDELAGSAGFDLLAGPGGSAEPIQDLVVVANITYGQVPAEDDAYYQYGFVFDSDNNPDNNYQPSPAFPNDFFQDTDRWYEALYDPYSGWSLRVTDARDGELNPVTDSRAHLVVVDNVLMLLVPADEFVVPDPMYRTTAFRHYGDYGLNPPYEWSGDVEPPVDLGLKRIDF